MIDRDPRKDPQPGDRFMVDGATMTVETREKRRPNQFEYGLGNAKDYIRYRLSAWPGARFIMASSRLRKIGAKVLPRVKV